MKYINEKYARYVENINSVSEYMIFIQSLADSTFDEHKRNEIRNIIQSTVAYNATIISLYGSIELFIDEIADIYIDLLYKIIEKYENMPTKLREKHETVTGEFISAPNRFNNFDIKKIDAVKNLSDCLNGNPKSQLNKKMLLRHSGNMRIEQICQFFSGIGIEDFKGKLLNNDIFIEGYASSKGYSLEDAKNRLNSLKKDEADLCSLFFELENLVDQRNQVAHSGRVDEKMSYDYIRDNTIPFLLLLGKVIEDILTSELLKMSSENDKLFLFPEIYQVINNEIILLNRGEATLNVGDMIVCEHSGLFFETRVLSIRVNNIDVESVVGLADEDISIKVGKKVKDNWKFYAYK